MINQQTYVTTVIFLSPTCDGTCHGTPIVHTATDDHFSMIYPECGDRGTTSYGPSRLIYSDPDTTLVTRLEFSLDVTVFSGKYIEKRVK
jgi:hypothetical protein